MTSPRSIIAFCILFLGAFASFAGDSKQPTRKVFIGEDGKTVTIEGDRPFLVAEDGPLRGGFLGVATKDMTAELRAYFGAPKDSGVLVAKVVADSPAQRAGLKVGDVITAVDGKPADSPWTLGALIRDRKEGDQVKIEFVRNGKSQQSFVTIAERERQVLQFRVGPDGPMIAGEPLQFRTQALERVQEYFDSPAWQTKINKMGDCSELQQKLEALEKRMKELEKKLQK